MAENSKDEVDLYVFITARHVHTDDLGIAHKWNENQKTGTVCSAKRNLRTSLSVYGKTGEIKNKVLYTAEVSSIVIGASYTCYNEYYKIKNVVNVNLKKR